MRTALPAHVPGTPDMRAADRGAGEVVAAFAGTLPDATSGPTECQDILLDKHWTMSLSCGYSVSL